LNTKTGDLSVYTPLIINAGTVPLVPPIVPNITANDVVGIWFGSNAVTLTLDNTTANCINGLTKNGVLSVFGQVAACNAKQFIKAANKAINKGILVIPPLGTTANGQPCYTTRSFAVVDQDQSDNVVSKYLSVGTQTMQFNVANKAAFPNATELDNGSDNRLLDAFILPALNCTPFTVPDLVDGNTRGAQILNELQAAQFQRRPVALVPSGNPMTLVNGTTDIQKVNLFRSIVNQPRLQHPVASTKRYCHNLINVGLPELIRDQQFTNVSVSPVAGTNLFVFLIQRFITSLTNLNCLVLLNITAPVALDANNNVKLTDVTKVTSTSGTCGSLVNAGCGTGCCSRFGYCGSTVEYCGTGCQTGFGTCGSTPN
jgi:hypothetical protein